MKVAGSHLSTFAAVNERSRPGRFMKHESSACCAPGPVPTAEWASFVVLSLGLFSIYQPGGRVPPARATVLNIPWTVGSPSTPKPPRRSLDSLPAARPARWPPVSRWVRPRSLDVVAVTGAAKMFTIGWWPGKAPHQPLSCLSRIECRAALPRTAAGTPVPRPAVDVAVSDSV